MGTKEKISDDECTFPPDEPMPPEVLGQYTLGHDLHDETEIVDYVNGQCRGEETVKYVERIKTEYVSGQRYDAWDVHTDKERWWVLTNLTNLYSQKHFPSLDFTLSFHIGLMHRIQSRQDRAERVEPFDEVYRRQEEVVGLIVEGVEAEDFQAAAMRLRECLITLAATVRRRTQLSGNGDAPKDADVVSWNELLINHFCHGERNKVLRQYLKATSDRTWQLVNWLTHDRDANKTAAMIAHEAVSTLTGHFIGLVIRERVDLAEQCPQCSSRNVRSYYDAAIEPDGAYYERCKSCDWNNHP